MGIRFWVGRRSWIRGFEGRVLAFFSSLLRGCWRELSAEVVIDQSSFVLGWVMTVLMLEFLLYKYVNTTAKIVTFSWTVPQ